MSIRNPSDFFKRKKNDSLKEEQAQKKLEEQKLQNKKIDAPKKHFGENKVVEEPAAIIPEEVKVDPYLEEINSLKSDIQSVVGLIPEETDLTEVFNTLESLKERIDNVADKASYDGDITILRSEIREVERSIPEKFDPSNINSNLASLKERIELVRSEIPTVPEPVLYDDQIDEIKGLIEQVKGSIPEVPEVRYYEKELNLILDLIEGVKEDIPTVPEIPEIKYYDEEISSVESQIKEIESSISNLPEIKHYDNDIDEVKELLEKLSSKVTEIPEIKYYDNDLKDLKDKILNVEESIPTVPEVKYYDEEIKGLNNEIVGLFKKVSSIKIPEAKSYDGEIKKIYSSFEEKNQTLQNKIEKLEETFEKFDKEVISEGLLNIPPDENNSDPLTPLDQKFVTYEKLQENYRLFVNRVQQQLASFGGGGIEDAPQDGQEYTRKDQKWVVNSGGATPTGIAGTWGVDTVGIHTVKNVGIGSTARLDSALYVFGDAEITGNISVAGTLTKQDVTNVDSVGMITGRGDLNIQRNVRLSGVTTIGDTSGVGTVFIGTGNTTLIVDGNARVLGILTIGRSSITIDGDAEEVSVGIVTITNEAVTVGDNVSIDATATGINSAPNVYYVAKDGVDTNNGTSIDNAFLTIKAAVGIAESGSTIKVLSGNYVEQNPIEVPAFVAIVGDDQRSVKVLPNTTNKDLFHVRKGCKLASMTFSGHTAPAAAVGFPTTEIAENVGGGKWKGPYVQNCTSDTTTGVGIRIDGKQARSLKAMNVDSFTQYNQGGVGVAVTNSGFAQLVSVFTICCDEAISCDAGGQADLANSNCSFGTKGLVSRGTGALQFTGTVSSEAAVSQDNVTVNLSTPTLNISNFQYTHQTGVATVTTTADHNFSVGMGVTLAGIAVTCGAGRSEHTFVSGITSAITANNSTKYTASTGTTYDPLTGVLVIGIGSHSLTTSNTITIDNGGLTFTCDADDNATEHPYPRATDPISGISTAITAVSATTITVNVGAVGNQTKTYPYQNPYVFEVDETPTARKFVINVGVSKHIHNYVSGGTAKVDIDRPYDGQVAYFDTLYKTVQSITVDSGGTGYTSTPEVTVASSPTGETATAFATLEGDSVSSITIISSGNQYTSTPNVTINGGGGSGASATANMSSIYYTINSSTPVVSGISTLTIDTNLLNTVGVGSTVYFFQQSKIIASSHTFEYVGAGNNITSATPKRGGVTVQENEVITSDGGVVIYTSTDQAGNFRIGNDLQINQNTGTISGRAFSKSLFTEMTPFILALS